MYKNVAHDCKNLSKLNAQPTSEMEWFFFINSKQVLKIK